ncbi:disulfide oxidoreductase [bacterium CG2_30_54_10]|nr:MAG: disulfide oxidoreductase [bacterium CG2_30_54_10]
MNKITPEMTIAQALKENPEAENILREFGMHCIGCSISTGESLSDAANVHGIDLPKLLEALNK